MDKQNMKKAAIYIRTSTEGQENSIKIQKERLLEYCKIKNFEIYEIYTDFGWSGKNIERPAFEQMMKDARNQKFNIVIVLKIDRFARSLMDCLINIEKLKKLNIAFMAADQPIDTSSAMGQLTMQIMAAFAEFERAMIRERMLVGRQKAEQNGTICHRPRKKLPKREILRYLGKNLSATAIAKIYDVKTPTITNRLTEWGYVYTNDQWLQTDELLPLISQEE